MLQCPSCSGPVPDSARYCPGCGRPVEASESPTHTAPRPTPRTPSSPPLSSSPPGSGAGADGRFVPGTVLAGRFRIVGLLGRGGMGEVYRADDLKLGQPVALKLLPEGLEHDPERLERLFNEVRLARQISHPSVCRMYDVGEVDGQHFLSMEFVDGEDLASLLRRIGRLPGDKALDIARQLCVGLAAAHERGILHRDLKPANVMLDGRGKVRITDFGLAGLAEAAAADTRSGTPAYMSPEQLQGREVSTRSDVYALGLVLYELFTGRRAFEGRTPAELLRQHRETTPASPSTLVSDLDPAVERVMLRCIEEDPRQRPASVLAVAGALPGGDPLGAALAAGEIPSPEMLAAAGEKGGLSTGTAWTCLAWVVFGLAGLLFAPGHWMLHRWVSWDKAPAALEDRARDMLRRLGHAVPPADTAQGFDVDQDYLRYLATRDSSPRRWSRLSGPRSWALGFWHRESPQPMVSGGLTSVVSYDNPPIVASGMAGVMLDLSGRLQDFYVVPPQLEEAAGPAPPPDFSPLFAAAGLDLAAFHPVEPRWTPPFFCDTRAAWEGTLPDEPGVVLRVEAGAYRGRPAFFRVVTPWDRPERMRSFEWTRPMTAAVVLQVVLSLAIIATSGFLARRNVRLGRGDRKGAFRLAAWTFWAVMALWALRANHVPLPIDELEMLVRAVGLALLQAGVLWLLYLAVEPYVRRRWPERLISWTRLLAGRLRDPLVGRDLLIGAGFGILLSAVVEVSSAAIGWLGIVPPAPDVTVSLDVLINGAFLASEIVRSVVAGAAQAMTITVLLLLLRGLLRREWAAALALILLAAVQSALFVGGEVGGALFVFVLGGVLGGILVLALLRFGVLVLAATYLFHLLTSFPLFADLSSWTAAATLPVLAVAGGLAVYAFHTSLAGRPVLKVDGVLD